MISAKPSRTSHKVVTVALQDCVCKYTIMGAYWCYEAC